jgi:hypothetical protein
MHFEGLTLNFYFKGRIFYASITAGKVLSLFFFF